MNEQWRLLEIGEASVETDEFFNVYKSPPEWMLVNTVGQITDISLPHRRKIETSWREIKDRSEITCPCVLTDGVNSFGIVKTSGLPRVQDYGYWHPLPQFPERLPDEEKAWREYCESYRASPGERVERKAFEAGFKAAKGAK